MHRHSIKYCRLLILGTSAIQLMWLATSCAEDHYGEAQANAIRFEVVSVAPEAASRSCCLAESAEGDSLCLCAHISDYCGDVEMEAEKSRAALSTSPGNFLLSCAIFDNGSSAFKNYYFQGEKYNSAGNNAAGNSFYWLSTGNCKYRFYGIAPYERNGASNGYTVDYSGVAGKPSIQFTVPAEADNQFDLMSVTTTDYADNNKIIVPLSFSHLCTAITFSADPSCTGIQIDNVSIKGVYNSGSYDMASKTWQVNTSSTANYSKVLKKIITAGDNSITASGQATFFLLPQTIPSGATVEVVYITSSGTSTLSASLSGMAWSAGKKVNFVVSPTLISAEQEGLHIKGIASPDVISASGTSFSIKQSGTATVLASGGATTDGTSFTIPASAFIDKLADASLTGTHSYDITLTSKNDASKTLTVPSVQFQFDYMAYTVNVTDGYDVTVPFKNNSSTNGSTILIRWDEGQFSDELTTNITNRYRNYGTTGQRQIRIYSDLKGTYAVPNYSSNTWGSYNFPSQTIKVDTPILPSSQTNLSYLFRDCANLTSIPSNLFDKVGDKITNYSYIFSSCKSLSEIPAELFDKSTAATDFSYAFYECTSLTTLPSGLFAKCSNVTTFDNTFNGCDHLETIQEDIFKNCTQVTSFNWTFNYCTQLKAIPTGLFDSCTKVNYFTGTFKQCESITEIPANLFDYCTDASSFSSTFAYCKKITAIPTGLFDKCTNVKSFESTFQACSALTAIPSGLFDQGANVTTFQETFSGCEEIAEIPAKLFDKCPKVTTFGYTFYDCNKISSIPIGLFDKCTEVTTFSDTFNYCSSLASIPAGLFDNCTKVTTFSWTFANCKSLTSIPTGLFDKCTEVTTFSDTFNNCSSLASIPSGLFDKCTQVTDFSYAFNGCAKITIIPEHLFDYCTAVTNFSCTFKGLGITSIPAGLFDNCKEATLFGSTFDGCTKLTTIPASLFDNCTNVTDFSYTFQSCEKITSVVPELWNTTKWSNVTQHSRCFYKCESASNYSSIPEDWSTN